MHDPPLPPAGIRLVPDPGLRRTEGGRVLVGGAPLRIMRLSDAGAAVVSAWLDGTPLADVKSARRLARRVIDAAMLHPVVDPVPAIGVTVVIPSKDDAEVLDRCLGSQAEGPVVVVDDGSADGAAIAEVCARHGARYVRRDVSGGPGRARATGLTLVDTPLVAFVDTDVEVWPGWLDHLVAHFDDPAVVAVAPRVRSRASSSLLARYEALHSPLDLGSARANVGPGRPVAYVPTAASVARYEAIDAVGGFDPDLRVGEDVDLVWRLVADGGTVRYDADVEVTHDPRSSWWRWLRQRWAYGTSAAKLARRHGAEVAPARCSVWSLGAWLAILLRRPAIGVAVAVGSSAALVPKLDGLEHPGQEAVRIAGAGHLHAGRGLARAVARVWWPPAALVGLAMPRTRLPIAAAVVGPHLTDWIRGARPADPVRSVALRVVDDFAYGVGVWHGAIAHRDPTALLPDLAEWPGGRRAVEPDTVPGS